MNAKIRINRRYTLWLLIVAVIFIMERYSNHPIDNFVNRVFLFNHSELFDKNILGDVFFKGSSYSKIEHVTLKLSENSNLSDDRIIPLSKIIDISKFKKIRLDGNNQVFSDEKYEYIYFDVEDDFLIAYPIQK